MDYMSNDFIKESTPSIGKRKKTNITHPQPLSKKQIVEYMDEKREEGMQKSIDSNNKGFQLLQKFGYQSGGLGKDNSGISEPIKIRKREASDRFSIFYMCLHLLLVPVGQVLVKILFD